MKTISKADAFLSKMGFPLGGPDINAVISSLLYDMEASLAAEPDLNSTLSGSQAMIPTWIVPPEESLSNKKVIVIDAGGTNFRACFVSFDENGLPSIEKLQKCSMPGIDREFSKKEFFSQIAQNLDHLKDEANALVDGIRIGFCFSYAMQITPEGDGIVMEFSKEIKAQEVVGSLVGQSLSDALVERGWKKPQKITLLNDTTAALLAGAANAPAGKKYSSYIGLILGTGMNSAYIEPNQIKKITSSKAPLKQIVVCESGMFNKVQRSSLDIAFDKTTKSPGAYVTEKMCSGCYLGSTALLMLKEAAKAELFSKEVATGITTLLSLELKDMDQFFYGPYRVDTVLGSIVKKGSQEDYDNMFRLLDAYVERSARLTAAVIAASVIKSGEGKSPALPVSVLCEGTTFYKTYRLKERLNGYLQQALVEQRGLHYEIVSLDNAITLGAAVAGLSN